MTRGRYIPGPRPELHGEPFECAEDAWFWYLQCRSAREAGARIVAGLGLVARPCEPEDVLTVVERLYRSDRLGSDHLRVLLDYGYCQMRPSSEGQAERRAAAIWDEAVARLSVAFKAKGIIK